MTPKAASAGDGNVREGDIAITAVAEHYVIGRMTRDCKTQEFLTSKQTRAEALQEACVLADMMHRVFLCEDAGKSAYFLVNSAEPSPSTALKGRPVRKEKRS